MQVAGWYRDPSGAPLDRWWDGGQWTPHTQPMGWATMQRQQARSARATGALARLILWVLGIIAFVIVATVLVALIVNASA